MKIALAAWNDRIAPVFDVAPWVQLVEVDSGRILFQGPRALAGDLAFQKALALVEMGAEILICGAISRSLLAIVSGYGIQVVPFVSGRLDAVIQAWNRGRLENGDFHMPGCRGRWKRGSGPGHGSYKEVNSMNGKNRGGRGQGGRQGQGRGAGSRRPGPGGDCVCPKCGHTQPHQRGVPCMDLKCPGCGATMTRG